MNEKTTITLEITDDTAMIELGRHCGQHLPNRCVAFLYGDLGAGKTTWMRGLLDGLGSKDKVLSPTYPLIRSYELKSGTLQHLDLYRLTDEEDLLQSGLLDEIADAPKVFIEWPQRCVAVLPTPTMEITFTIAATAHNVSMPITTAQQLSLTQTQG